jgi:hypothetical protein
MARYIITIALAIISINSNNLIFTNTLHLSNDYSIVATQKPHFIHSNVPGAVINFQNIFWKFFLSENNSNECSQDRNTRAIKLSRQARVVRSS